MHGRVKKDVVEPTPEELEKQREHVRTAKALFGKLLEARQGKVYSQQTFDMTSKALQFHPEFPTLWGYRREILQSGRLPDEEGSRKVRLEGELKLLEKALRKTQKVYSIWFHRKWTIERLFELAAAEGPAADAQKLLDTELELCGRLFDVDERNFHCWNHRAHVLGLMRQSLQPRQSRPGTAGSACSGDFRIAPPEAWAAIHRRFGGAGAGAAEGAGKAAPDLIGLDLKLSRDLINKNFSNYSAWHLRALLQTPPPRDDTRRDRPSANDPRLEHVDMAAELEWVQQGIYTEPNDQSVWLYHHWLTTLGRGCEQLRITHCAALGGELVVFFSQAVCAWAWGGTAPQPPPAVVTLRRGAEVTLTGRLEPLGPDALSAPSAAARRTRQLPRERKRWALGWRFVPEGAAIGDLAGGEVRVEASVELDGSHPDGTVAHAWRRLSFAGLPALCDMAEAPGPSPALAALIAAPPSPDRASVLQGELARVEELLEIEEDCRWALLARGRLAVAAAAGSSPEAVEAAEKLVVDGYERITALDPLRGGFYAEAKAASLTRLRALAWLRGGSLSAPLALDGLSLRHLAPSAAASFFGVRVLSVEGNNLRTFGALLHLTSLEELRAARNRLRGDVSEAFSLPRLRRLDVAHNDLGLAGGAAAAPGPALAEVDLSSNPAALGALEGGGEDAALARLLAGAPAEARGAWSAEVNLAGGTLVCRRRG